MLPKNRLKDVISSFSLDVIHVSFGASRIDEFDAQKLEQQQQQNFSKPFQLGKIFFIKYICIMNLTDFRKTMETGVDPRLPIMLFCLVTVFSLVIVRVKS